MRKNVWILNHYAGGMLFDQGGRHYNFAKYLKIKGYEPTVFCCNALHGVAQTHYADPSLWHEHLAEEIGVPFVFVKGRTYSDNGKDRVLNMVDFYRNVQKAARIYAKEHEKPDVIFASSVHPLTLVAGLRLAKHFGVKCVCEIRDLWPESIVTYSSRLTRENPLIRFLYAGEKWIYKKADAVVFTMEGAYDYILERGWEKDIPQDKVFYINNGVDLETFGTNAAACPIQDADLDDEESFKVVYAGSIREANDLGMLLDAAAQLKGTKAKFLLWGDGDERQSLEERAKAEGLDHVVFKGRVEKKCVPAIVQKADLNYLDVFSDEISRFGISPNKLFEYFAAGKPVLMPFSGKYNPSARYSCGVVCAPNADAIGEGIRKVMEASPAEREDMEYSARLAAEHFHFASLTDELISILEGV